MSEAANQYPEALEISPAAGGIAASVSVPGSKSITNRALVLSALAKSADGCHLRGVLRSEDTEVMIACLAKLGFRLEMDWRKSEVLIGSHSHRIIPEPAAELFVANSGTSMRFLCAMVALGTGGYRLDGVPRMRERPIEDLLAALRQLGADAQCELGNGCPPVTIESHGLVGGSVDIRGQTSSQYLSALLMIAPFTRSGVEIRLVGPLVSEPYIAMTLRMLEHWGAKVDRLAPEVFHVEPGLLGEVKEYAIEPDASAASYFFAVAAILQGRVTVLDLPENSLQGDVHFVDVLEQMGCRIEKCAAGITVHGGPLRGVDVDMNAISDTVMTLGAVACFAEGPTTIRNVAHIRHKETDRIAALATELRKVGAAVEESADGLKITPRPLHGAGIDTYNDHRMAMSMALIGLRVPGMVIRNPGCVAKTYPGFWRDLEKLRMG
jgi:3-phosphoshikimate 1-carboxyvinyltransferase